MNRNTIGVVLAGGMSTRMGCDKKEIVLANGKSFLSHAAERLASRCETVVVSGVTFSDFSDSDRLMLQHCKLVCLPDAFPFRGPLCGLLTVLHWLDSQEVIHTQNHSTQILITPVDLPNLTNDDIDVMLATAAMQDALAPKPTIATFDSVHLDPMVGIYPVELVEELRQLAQTEHRSLYRWLVDREINRCILPIHSGINMNTPEDLGNLTSLFQPYTPPPSS